MEVSKIDLYVDGISFVPGNLIINPGVVWSLGTAHAVGRSDFDLIKSIYRSFIPVAPEFIHPMKAVKSKSVSYRQNVF